MENSLSYFVRLYFLTAKSFNWKINGHFVRVFLFFFFSLYFFRFYCVKCVIHQQDEVESTMDETTNNRAIVIGYSEKTATQTGRLIFETFLNTTNTRNSG